MAIRDALRRYGKSLHADVAEPSQDLLVLGLVLARRRTSIALKQLRYQLRLEVHEDEKTVYFQEAVWEADDGPRSGHDLAGQFGPKEEAYAVTAAEAPGSVEHVVSRFASRYTIATDFPQIRQGLKAACEPEGYRLKHLQPL